LSEAVIVADPRGRVLYLNSQAERLTGAPLSVARQQGLNDLFRLAHRSSGEPAPDALDLALASTDRPELLSDYDLIGAVGSPNTPIVWRTRQIWAPDGNIAGLVIYFRDPAQMTLTPEELLKANRFESLGAVAGGISHDFNNLLTTILGGISQAKDNRDPSLLADSERACLAAKALTKQLLSVARGSSNEPMQVASPLELLREATSLARAGTNAEINLDVPENLGGIRVNRSEILQVFQNLIINALQALPENGGKIRLHASGVTLAENEVPPLPAGDYIEIEIKDNGSGIPPENLEKIFEPFFTTKKHGTGLGLATVVNIVRKHGGVVRVMSTVGQGTTFSVLLPRTQEETKVESRRAPVLRFGTGRILLMDDDPDICHVAGSMLSSLDYKFDTARDGDEAIALYRRYLNIGRPYDVVILDLTVIGGKGGEETFLELRKLDPDVRAIVCSGYDSADMAQRFLDLGFCGYLTKPFRVPDLGRMLKNVLGSENSL
jgi:signal transduction histidine kinase/CheY-like chemotaxis protein